MRDARHLFKNNTGAFYFRYQIPNWMQEKSKFSSKSIYLSLKTYDQKKANLMSKALWAKLHMVANSKSTRDNLNQQPSINELLKRYRDCIAGAEEYEQEAMYWGKPQFEDILERIGGELRRIKATNLLDELEYDFSNLSDLTETALAIQNQNHPATE